MASPHKIFNFMGALRCFLVHSGAGVLTRITRLQELLIMIVASIGLSRKIVSSCSILD